MTQESTACSGQAQRDVRSLLLLDAGIEAMSAAALTAAALTAPHSGAWQMPGSITSTGIGIAATGFAGAAIALVTSANRIGHVEIGRISTPLAMLGLGNVAAAVGLGAWGAIDRDLGRGIRTILVASGISVATMGAAQAWRARKIHCASQ
ncbi:hypothetical protein [Rhodococcus sp. OK302]|uniref:hypothetical protein n=1 Tax=Rhodococcus sp. OK302 TaxID=1882769 RepID=UPI000B9F3A92|nr:hypothetical protein [Rhodococcus sp. OK302]OYD61075.1 hypothetical protein BDB13_6013 [Rhodococcus sp. OK302]